MRSYCGTAVPLMLITGKSRNTGSTGDAELKWCGWYALDIPDVDKQSKMPFPCFFWDKTLTDGKVYQPKLTASSPNSSYEICPMATYCHKD